MSNIEFEIKSIKTRNAIKMSLKLLLIGDPHFKVTNVEDTNELHKNIITIATNIKPDKIIVLGDLLDRHESIHVSPLKRITHFLEDLLKIAPLVILVGNHDRPNNSVFLTEDSPFVSFKNWPNTIIADVPITEKIGNYSFTYVPYVSPGRFVEAMNLYNIDWKSSKCIFAHQEFKGAQMGHVLSELGDEWSLDFPQVYSGHIHDYQILDNITYIGTPMQHKFGENTNKTISLLEIEGDIRETRISTNMIKKISVTINYSDIDQYKPNERNKLRIVVICDSSEMKAFSKNKKIKEWRKNGIVVTHKYQKNETKMKIEIRNKTSFIESLKEYVGKDKKQIVWINKIL